MKYPRRELVEHIRNAYPTGTRVRLVRMEDIDAPPEGTMGTVIAVDDLGSILVEWDDGTSLSVVYGVDRCEAVYEDN